MMDEQCSMQNEARRLADRSIVVVDYDPCWTTQFEKLRDRLAAALGSLVVTIEHVGSTAVPGLAAKPIIDIDALLHSTDDLPVAIERLAKIGYRHQGDLGIAGREAFISSVNAVAHHFYICHPDSREYQRHLVFRNHLRSHPEDARAYGALKRALAVRFADDRAVYCDGKMDFITGILDLATSGVPA